MTMSNCSHTTTCVCTSSQFWMRLVLAVCAFAHGQLFADPFVVQRMDGIALHFYYDWVTPTVLDYAHTLYPDKFIMNTESCVGVCMVHTCLTAWHTQVPHSTP